jgi:hypothetical protein
MRILDRLFGHHPAPHNDWQRRSALPHPSRTLGRTTGQVTSDEAVAHYRDLIRAAPRAGMDPAHLEALAQLTPAQRRRVFQGMSRDQRLLVFKGLIRDLPFQEWSDYDDQQARAGTETGATPHRPSTLERTFGRMNPAGIGSLGGFMAGNILSSIATVVFGSTIADAIFEDGNDGDGVQVGSTADNIRQETDTAEATFDSGNAKFDTTADVASGDFGGSGDVNFGDFNSGEFF